MKRRILDAIYILIGLLVAMTLGVQIFIASKIIILVIVAICSIYLGRFIFK